MKRLWKTGLSLGVLMLLLGVQGATATMPGSVKLTQSAITTLAMDGSRVAYASGGKVRNRSTRAPRFTRPAKMGRFGR